MRGRVLIGGRGLTEDVPLWELSRRGREDQLRPGANLAAVIAPRRCGCRKWNQCS